MAIFQAAMRRGLPRQAGGDMWPPEVSGLPGFPAMQAPSEDTVEPPADADQGLAATANPMSPDPQGPDRPLTAARARLLRRGLPRVAGGELWPPQVQGAPGICAGPEPDSSASSPTQSPGHWEEPPASEVSTPHPAAAGVVKSTRPLRRGLPRTPGGLPYPQYSLAQPTESGAASSTAAPTVNAPRDYPAARGDAASLPAGPLRPSASVPADLKPATPGPESAAILQALPKSLAKRPPPRPEKAPGPGVSHTVSKGRSRDRSRAAQATLWGVGLLLAAAVTVLATRGLIGFSGVSAFIDRYPGETHLPAGASVGLPVWVRWQHFLNLFFMILIIRSGIQIRQEQRPAAYWTPHWSKGGDGKVSLTVWFHQCLDMLWLLNGFAFIVLLFVTDHWMRIVPTSWEVFPNALSALLQYLSLDWPTENGWVNYNSLQQLMYALTIFVAAPLAAVTGFRMSSLWPKKAQKVSAIYPVEVARMLHFPVMLYFVVFIIVHVALVFSTGALRNLNHMYAGQDVINWSGFWIFAGSLALITGAWFAARPFILAPIASFMGKVSSR